MSLYPTAAYRSRFTVRDSSSCSTWLPQTLAVDLRPTPAAEFPNDNPALHHGARWVCLRTRGASRAVWRWAGDSSPAAPLSSSAQAPRPAPPSGAESPWPPSPFALVLPEPSPAQPPRPEPEESLPLVLDIDTSRIVLPQRVADVPPPPAFVFRPFRRTRPEVTVDPERPVGIAQMLDVSSSETGRAQVRRGSRVDVAPCIDLQQPSAPPVALSLASVASEVKDMSETEPAPRIEPERRRSRRAAAARRGPITSSSGEELEQAILELESAFGERVALAAP